MNPIGRIEYLIIHHTERNNDFPAFIRSRHIHLRGWDDIGYHYMIGNTRPFTTNGKLYTGRPEECEGAHTRQYNKNSLGICLIGNFDKVAPSEQQLETLFLLIEQKRKQYDIPLNHVKGHSEFAGVEKSCPGRLVHMPYIRAVLDRKECFSYTRYAELLEQVTHSPLELTTYS